MTDQPRWRYWHLAAALIIFVAAGMYGSEAHAQTLDQQGLEQLGGCEADSSGGYDANTGNGFYGRYQFTQGTWDWIMGELGYTQYIGVRPHLAPPDVQDEAALFLWNGPDEYPSRLGFGPDQFGPGHWPNCQHAVQQGGGGIVFTGLISS